MKTRKYKYSKITFCLSLILVIATSCEREISDNAVPATFPTTPFIFTDNPVGLTDEFFISFDPAVGANTEGFGTDNNVAFEGTSSIRIDVPTPSDPNGNFIGGIFKDRGAGRDLSGYDALTFWARGTVTATVEVGFGTDFELDQFPVSTRFQLSTDWRKITIPIPDASKLTQEKGMFLFSAGSFDILQNDDPALGSSFDDNIGFTMWFDEMQFEKLGTLGQLRPAIFNGVDEAVETFSGSSIQTTGISYTANLASGVNQTVQLSTNYFTFNSSDTNIATVSETGEITVLNEGTAVITAAIGDIDAAGSLTITATGPFENAPIPTRPAANVLSLYSDTYSGVTGLDPGTFNGNGVQIETSSFNNNQHIIYGNLNFVGIGWDGTVDVSSFTHIHVDVQLTSPPGTALTVELIDFGPNDTDNGLRGTDDTAGGFNATSQLTEGEWVGLDIPLNAFTLPTGGGGSGSPNLNNIGYFVLVSNRGSFLIDNIYFYRN
ncbi:Ig-like domain-containing protein [uncultured Polaribacter sp.]|uniref:Ig-like domain-containing protein n=1 Tax=uncultured Polaribacter sp. TaxID=174711 RepID=UPI002610966C|nr:Ig-like domain-containing protein [uncultured Polaribacter sp.]